jgi:transposase
LDDDGAINAERFRVYVEQVLAPTLTPGDIVVMDNLGSHKGKPVRRAIRQTGAKLIVGTICPPDRLLIPSNSCPNTCPTST